MKVCFTEQGWEDYLFWTDNDRNTHRKINDLIREIRRSPFKGLGKPEPLKGALSGCWSRRITGEHRLVYLVAGTPGIDQQMQIIQCRYHY